MSFLDEVAKREASKKESAENIQNKMPAWVAAVNELFRFVRHHVRPDASGPEQVKVAETEIRIEGYQMSRLEISYERRTVTLTPQRLDPLNNGKGGTVHIETSGQMPHRLLWDGESHSVKDHWEIATVIAGSEEPLTEESFDKLLTHLFVFDK